MNKHPVKSLGLSNWKEENRKTKSDQGWVPRLWRNTNPEVLAHKNPIMMKISREQLNVKPGTRTFFSWLRCFFVYQDCGRVIESCAVIFYFGILNLLADCPNLKLPLGISITIWATHCSFSNWCRFRVLSYIPDLQSCHSVVILSHFIPHNWLIWHRQGPVKQLLQ